jgi:multicomponent Na+:H+ antiporter subunit E
VTRAVRMLWLVVVWLALWSDLSVANVASGIITAGVVIALFDSWRPGAVVVRPVAVARFALHFAYKLVQASLVVARTVVAPQHRIHAGIVAVELSGCSDAVATLVADAVSLTPGTLTLEVVRDPLTLYVHALDVRDVEHVKAEVRKMEELAVRAFGPGRPAPGRAR